MKKKCLRVGVLSIAGGGLLLLSGCIVETGPPVAYAPPPVVYSPQPVVEEAPPVAEVTVMVPDSYVWDGYEYVGFVGGQYFYLGPGSVWVVAEPWRMDRFHGWQRDHPDWQDHAIRNDRYRRDAYGRVAPMHDANGAIRRNENGAAMHDENGAATHDDKGPATHGDKEGAKPKPGEKKKSH